MGYEVLIEHKLEQSKRMDTIKQRLENALDTELAEMCQALKIDKTDDISKIEKAYQDASGHILSRKFMSVEVQYKQVLIDVADKLKPSFGWTDFRLKDSSSEEEVESAIESFVAERFRKKWTKLSARERKAKEQELKSELEKAGYSQTTIEGAIGFLGSGAAGIAVAAPVTMSVFYSGVMASISVSLFGMSTGLLLLSGTGVGLVVSVPLLVILLGGNSYRKTIPATLLLIRIRRRLEGEGLL